MNTKIYNANIVTDKGIVYGEIDITENRIVHIGGCMEKKMDWDREIDAQGNLIIPGFKNAHAHAPMTFLRSFADDLPLDEWLNKQVFPAESKLNPGDIYELTKLAILEYLTSGITSSFEMYYYPESIAMAAKDMGYRVVLGGTILGNDLRKVRELEDDYVAWNRYHELVSFQLGFHGEYTTAKEMIQEIGQLSQKYHAPVYMHCQETRKETDDCKKRYGISPIQLFESLGIWEYGGAGHHCIYLDEADMHILQKKKIGVVTNPSSNLKLASGIAPVQKLLDNNIKVAIGTDGPASNNCLDMFREMFLVTGLQKYLLQDAGAMSAEHVLTMATKNGAAVMGLSDCDSLAVGKLADLVMIDIHQPNMRPIHNMIKNLVYSGSKTNVKMTMVNGRILYENGCFHVGDDAERIYQQAEAVARRILYGK